MCLAGFLSRCSVACLRFDILGLFSFLALSTMYIVGASDCHAALQHLWFGQSDCAGIHMLFFPQLGCFSSVYATAFSFVSHSSGSLASISLFRARKLSYALVRKTARTSCTHLKLVMSRSRSIRGPSFRPSRKMTISQVEVLHLSYILELHHSSHELSRCSSPEHRVNSFCATLCLRPKTSSKLWRL